MSIPNREKPSAPTVPAQPCEKLLGPGERISDRFEILKLAGAGGMGEVYQAWDSLLERPVGLKAVRPRQEDGAEYLERFRREALALAQLSHPNVCQVYDLVSSSQGTFIALEWLEGETLDQAAPNLDAGRKLRLLTQAAQGLEAAHAKGMVHRDLKPGNLMVTPEGQLKILDFGLARLMDGDLSPAPEAPFPLPSVPDDELATATVRTEPSLPRPSRSSEHLTQQGFFMGSPRYASPEQIRGEAVGPGSDVYSLGVLAWELLNGENPFPGEGRARLRAVVDNRRRAWTARKVPRAVVQLIDGMLAPRPQARPSAAEAARVLENCQRPLGAGWWIGLGALAALLLGGFTFSLVSRGVIADLARGRDARVAILPVQNLTGEGSIQAELRWVLPELLGLALQDAPRLAPIPASELQGGLERLGPLPPRPDRAQLERLAAPLGADLFLLSEVKAGASGWELHFHLLDRQGRIRTEGIQAGNPGSQGLQALARGAAERLARAVQPLGSRPERPRIEVPAQALKDFGEGKELASRGEFKEALGPLRRASESAPHFGPAIVQWGICLRKTGDPMAIAAVQWGRWAGHSAHLVRVEIQALVETGLIALDQGRWEASQTALDEAMALALRTGDEDFQSAILNNQAYLLMERHQHTAAEPLLHRALLISKKLGKQLEQTLTLNNLAVIAKERGDFAGAQVHYQTVLEVARGLGDRSMEAMALNNLGDVALCQLRFADAEAQFRGALQVREATGQRSGLIIPRANLGILARVQGRWDEGRAQLDQALSLCRELNREPLEALVRFQMGLLELSAGQPRQALPHFQAAEALSQKLGDPAGQAQALAGAAECALAQKELSRAEALTRRAHDLAPDSPFTLRAEALLLAQRGDRTGALEGLGKALASARATAPEEVPGLESRLAGLRAEGR